MGSKMIERAWQNKCQAYNRYRKELRTYGALDEGTARRWKIYKKARKQWEKLCPGESNEK